LCGLTANAAYFYSSALVKPIRVHTASVINLRGCDAILIGAALLQLVIPIARAGYDSLVF
jgi:hypothetical protein